ncbi:MAG: SDR family NAD(P)-dependent oxidoreductase, partial [Clostridia bacterium]|nr:SDR family NAD(P)-dependent oxidoreductase [Clostridia bacterium]
MEFVLITGAYGGMGKATVRLLAQKGFGVIALDRKTEPLGDGIYPIQADITDEQSVQNAFEQVKTITDKITAIIHFAGIYTLNSLVEIENAEFEKVFKVNVFGAYSINRIFLPLLDKGSKIIITTSELAPLAPLPFTGLYAVSKSALDKYAYSLKMELQLLGISVSVLRAGAVDTGMLGVSTTALDKFVENTKLYSCNATRFKKIVDSVEARSIKPEKLAQKMLKILNKKKPKFAYAINRNPLLLLLNAL